MKKREGIKKQTQKKTNHLFEILEDIKFSKKGNLVTEDEQNEYTKAFSPYMVLKFLSMNEELCEVVNLVGMYQSILSKKQFYDLLVAVIPPTKSYDKYITTTKQEEEFERRVSEYYQCSLREARYYIKSKGPEWSEIISKKLGGKA